MFSKRLQAILLLFIAESLITDVEARLVDINNVSTAITRLGRVELYYNGEWGTVCGDGFGDTEARVVCKELGFGPAGQFIPHQSPGVGRIWLDDVHCDGTESSIGDCQHNGWGSYNCSHQEDVWVSCNLDGTTPGSRARGGPKATWIDNKMARTGLSVDQLVNRTKQQWRTVVRNVANPRINEKDSTPSARVQDHVTTRDNNVVAKVLMLCSPSTSPTEYYDSGTVSSPNYPGNYWDNADCYWRLTSSSVAVSLTFNSFQIEAGYDFVTVFDGFSRASPLLDLLTGTEYSIRTHTTTQNYMFINFETDGSGTDSGFTAYFTSTDTPHEPCAPTSNPLRYYDTGTVFSPNHPYDYPQNADCHWLLTATTYATISLMFATFQTESSHDKVLIYDGNSVLSTLLADLSGSVDLSTVFVTTQPVMYLHFTTDSSVSYYGFSAIFWSSSSTSTPASSCSPASNPVQYYESGTFSSLNYPFNYPNNVDCHWLLTTTTNTIVSLTFDSFQTESCCDKVFIYDGNSMFSTELAELSGSIDLSTVYTTSQSNMYIYFTTDSGSTYSGFSASFRSSNAAEGRTQATTALILLVVFISKWIGSQWSDHLLP